MLNHHLFKKNLSNSKNFAYGLIFISVLTSCSSAEIASNGDTYSEELVEKSEQLNAREVALAKREMELDDRASTMGVGNVNQRSARADLKLLPPNAKPGQCYARVWVEPTYKTLEQQVMVNKASERVKILPAVYETVSETVLKKPETTKLATIPPVYKTVTEQKLVKNGGKFWKTSLRNGAPVDQDLIASVKKAGINLDSSSPGVCYHEHYKSAKFVTETENVLVKEESEKVEPVEAQYRWVEKKVLVSEASTQLEHTPANYKTVKEQVLDKPAHTVWKKGAGPIQKMDEATGEIMCLVEVPATYKMVSKQVLVSKAQTRSVAIPARYKTIKVRELVSDSAERRIKIPAEYKKVAVTKKVSEPTFVWHEVHDNTMAKESRTGRQICLVEEQPTYKTVEKSIVKTPAIVRKETIPAEYGTVTVKKLIKDAQEVKTAIPATYKTVSVKKVDSAGKMEWRSILCETNMTRARITDVQRALLNKGYKPGNIDGVIGQQTMQAVNNYQRDKGLPVDRYLNIDTLKSLKVSAI